MVLLGMLLCAGALQPQERQGRPSATNRLDGSQKRSARPAQRKLPASSSRIDPDRATVYGILPGGGQWYLGQEGSAFLQLGLFLGAEYLYREGQRDPDYIPAAERRVAFQPEEYFIARELDRFGLLYSDRPVPTGGNGALLLLAAYRQGLANPFVPNLIGESRGQRAMRMAGIAPGGGTGGAATAFEINPLVTYGGEYYRTNSATIHTDRFRDMSRWTLFYSIFSADRDARSYADGLEPLEDFTSLAAAPFRREILADPYVWLPVLATPLLLEWERGQGRSRDPLGARPYDLLAPPGTFSDPRIQSSMALRSLGDALAEEALFRGVAGRRLTARYGFAAGSLLSSSLYAAYRYGMGNENIWPQFAYSLYWSYLDFRADSDLRPTVASHFWTNMAILLYSLSRAREDERADRTSQEIHFMPVFFQFDI